MGKSGKNRGAVRKAPKARTDGQASERDASFDPGPHPGPGPSAAVSEPGPSAAVSKPGRSA